MTAPFRFDCHRCGHCCRVGHGHVWIEESEIPELAAARGMRVAAFTRLHVLRVGSRLSLREGPHGRCSLLEGLADCSVYAARPAQCRSFPYWPSILEGGDALLRAASYCPGIEILDRAPLPPAAPRLPPPAPGGDEAARPGPSPDRSGME